MKLFCESISPECYIQLAQEDADRGRRAFCTGLKEVSRGADKVGDNKGSLREA